MSLPIGLFDRGTPPKRRRAADPASSAVIPLWRFRAVLQVMIELFIHIAFQLSLAQETGKPAQNTRNCIIVILPPVS